MSKLKLRIHLDYVPEDVGVLANIYGKKNYRDLLIPAGDLHQGFERANPYKEITIKEGNYLLEVILPSGDLIQEDIEITKGEDKTLVLSPKKEKTFEREFLRWQNYIHGWQNPEDFYFPEDVIEHIPGISSLSVRLLSEKDYYLQRKKNLKHDLSENGLISKGYFFLKNDINSDLFTSEQLFSSIAEEKISLIEIHEGPWNDYMAFRDEMIPRFYLYIEGNKILPQYCVLPIPWRLFNTGEMAKIEALVSKIPFRSDSISDEGGRVSLSVRDNLIGAVLGYLNRGELSAALTSGKPALNYGEELLQGKLFNPFAATVGGYVLMKGTTDFEGQSLFWYDWINNLCEYFPFLPDGAILNGWLKLYQRKNDYLQEACNLFLEAFYRGIPYYSKGVEMLLDGLQIISSSDRYKQDDEVKKALTIIQKLALRVDVDQPFTCVVMEE